MFHIELIGVSGTQLDLRGRELVAQCCAVVASKRQIPMLESLELPVIPVAPISEMTAEVSRRLQEGNVAVLASGDPLFYGIGRTLLGRFAKEQIRIHPALSALQLACAAFHTPWDDLKIISMHGRDMGDAAGRILPHRKVMLFTDGTNSPDKVCRVLLESLALSGDHERTDRIRVSVAENLALDDERLTCGSLEVIAQGTFSPLNMMLIEQDTDEQTGGFGLSEHEIHHSRGLITKDEVRASSLHKLNLPAEGVLWDVGGGSGSVSLEAARLRPGLSVYTIERKPEEQENILANIRRYNAYNIHLIRGEAPEALKDLPAPDRVFIGGSAGRLGDIIEYAARRLGQDGRIVANAVLAETAEQAPEFMQQAGLDVETVEVTVSRKKYGSSEAVSFNPITIITGKS